MVGIFNNYYILIAFSRKSFYLFIMRAPHSLFSRRHRAFSMVEILVTTAIMGILAALVMSGLKGVTNRGKEAKCISNLRQISAGFLTYVGENNGYMPRPTIKASESGLGGDQMWSKQLGPYLPQRGNSATAQQNKVFICPSAQYTGVQLNDISSTYNCSAALFYFSPTASSTATGSATSGPARSFVGLDRPAQTILVAEGKQAGSEGSCQSSLNWTQVQQDLGSASPAGTANLDFRHDNKMNVLYADGHVGTIAFKDRSTAITQRIWDGRTF